MSVKVRLSAMMFLQYAIWGAWAPFLWPYLTAAAPDGLGFSNPQAGVIFGLLWLACIVGPFTGGQIADRYFPTEKFLSIAHLAGAVFLYLAARQTEYGAMVGMMAIFSLLYAPTLALTNSLAFHHLKSEKDFGSIRVWGTLGWITANIILAQWRSIGVPEGIADSLLLATVFSVLLGIYSLFLPHTPPASDKAADPLAFRQAFVMLKDRNFLIFVLIAFVVTTELQFYYGPTAGFLESAMKISHDKVPLVMPIAQAAEILAMAFLLPVMLRKWGIRKTLALGVIAWPLRYVVFALGPVGPLAIMQPLVVASLALHGLGYTFFFVVSYIYVDKVAPANIRASAQSMFNLITLGIGNWIGTQFTGQVLGYFKPETNTSAWTQVFLIPCVLTVVCAIAFLLFFKDNSDQLEKKMAAG